MAITIVAFRCRSDNYGVLIHDGARGVTAAIDAPDADAIRDEVDRRGWRLHLIFTTHHHGDHVAGNIALKERYGATIVGPAKEAAKIPGIDGLVDDGAVIEFADREIRVMATPGHTLGHVAYYLADENVVFVGDTLFAMGCGRLFEGTAEMMWASLARLAALPETTEVYCGHDYAAANARFALTIEPDNAALVARAGEAAAAARSGTLMPPTSIGRERATNPFLRVDQPGIRQRVNLPDAPAAEVFAALRRHKDAFA
jgi:hydroxyacylglutathione hydrolase